MTVSAKQTNEQHYSIVFNLWARATHASTISTHIGHNMETKSEIVDDHLSMVYIFTQLLIYLIFLVYTSNSTYSKTHFSRCYLLHTELLLIWKISYEFLSDFILSPTFKIHLRAPISFADGWYSWLCHFSSFHLPQN